MPTYHRWPQFMSDVHCCQNGENRDELALPGQVRIILTNMMKMCAPNMYHEGWPIGIVVVMGYLRWSDEVSYRTSSKMWGSWYFPRFPLLRDGSFTWINMASLMVLVMPCASLPTVEKQFRLTGCPVVWLCQ